MAISRAAGAQTLRKVLSFTFRHWAKRKALVSGVALAMSLATLTEVFVPLFAGRLIDALAAGPSATQAALKSFGTMALLGVAMISLRHFAWWGIVPLTLGVMRAVAQDAFHRVQRLSTDWHANSFAGSIVRKVTRGMWALDTLNDVLLLALLPSFVVLVGTMLLLGEHWPVMGVVMAVGAVAYRGPHGYPGDSRHRTGLAAVQCAGYADGRRAGGCVVLERRREGVRRGAPRGRPPGSRRRQVVAANVTNLDAPHLERYWTARVAVDRSKQP